MKIAGIEKCSMVDYPGRMAAVFFTPGCNWNCHYCHNRALLKTDEPRQALPWLDTEVALTLLDDRRGWLDGVVISGGEPTLQEGLAPFIRTIRAKDYLVKLDTNGTRPGVLAALLREELLDYVAMDLKAPMEKYEAVCGVPVDHRALNESIDLIMGAGIEYEFRTTVLPHFTDADLTAIAERIGGAQRYVLQQYRNPQSSIPEDPYFAIAEILPQLRAIVQQCETRGFEFTEEMAEYCAV